MNHNGMLTSTGLMPVHVRPFPVKHMRLLLPRLCARMLRTFYVRAYHVLCHLSPNHIHDTFFLCPNSSTLLSGQTQGHTHHMNTVETPIDCPGQSSCCRYLNNRTIQFETTDKNVLFRIRLTLLRYIIHTSKLCVVSNEY